MDDQHQPGQVTPSIFAHHSRVLGAAHAISAQERGTHINTQLYFIFNIGCSFLEPFGPYSPSLSTKNQL